MASNRSNRFRPEVEDLEGRLLLSGGLNPGLLTSAPAHAIPQDLAQQAADQRMGLPVLNSNPGAAATLHLDFTGDLERTWHWQFGEYFAYYQNVLTPAFDLDGHPESFNADE